MSKKLVKIVPVTEFLGSALQVFYSYVKYARFHPIGYGLKRPYNMIYDQKTINFNIAKSSCQQQAIEQYEGNRYKLLQHTYFAKLYHPVTQIVCHTTLIFWRSEGGCLQF